MIKPLYSAYGKLKTSIKNHFCSLLKLNFFLDQKKLEMKLKKNENLPNLKKLVSNCLIHRNTFYEPIQKGFVEQCRKNYPFWEKFKKHIFG